MILHHLYHMELGDVNILFCYSGSLVRQVTSKVTRGGEPISEEPVDERLKNIDPKIVDLIMSEVYKYVDISVMGWSPFQEPHN